MIMIYFSQKLLKKIGLLIIIKESISEIKWGRHVQMKMIGVMTIKCKEKKQDKSLLLRNWRKKI